VSSKRITGRALLGWAVLVGLAVAGCGSKHPIVEVKGKIAFADGKPLPEGTRLRFNPAEGSRGSASATTAADGSFEVQHVRGNKGAEVGKYTISVLPPEDHKGDFTALVPEGYIDGNELSAEVKEGMGPLDLTVKAAKK
jgi:hypothetical protein